VSIYIKPFDDSYLHLTGGTVSGDTVFLNGLTASTIFSGTTDVEQIIIDLIYKNVYEDNQFLPLSGGTGGSYNFTGTTTADTLTVSNDILPKQDNVSSLGKNFKRFRSLNTVNGVAVFFTASTKLTTNSIQLGSRELTENNIIITGDTAVGGQW